MTTGVPPANSAALSEGNSANGGAGTPRNWDALEIAAALRLVPQLQDELTLGQRMVDVLDRALRVASMTSPARHVQGILLARIVGDLRVVIVTSRIGHMAQALTQASALHEQAQVAQYVGDDDARAKGWDEWTNEWRAYPGRKGEPTVGAVTSMNESVGGAMSPHDVEGEVARRTWISKRFGALKHGLPWLLRAFYARLTAGGQPTVHVGPWDDIVAPPAARSAIRYAIESAGMATMPFVVRCCPREEAIAMLFEMDAIAKAVNELPLPATDLADAVAKAATDQAGGQTTNVD